MIAITLGEPAGIGVELVAQLAAKNELKGCVLIGDENFICQNIPEASALTIRHIPLAAKAKAGQLNALNSAYVLETIKTATLGCLSGEYDAMVTAPIHKGIINDAGIPFSGHTEYLAELTHTPQVVMMLLNSVMRVALVTTHIPLKDVSKQVTAEQIKSVTHILYQDLKHKFGIQQPSIAVCGLNPHAGEGGHIGQEELETIIPALDDLRMAGLYIHGPIPADTLFTPNKVKNYDAILAMYHDQGLAPLKYAGFGESVNITLGLPIIRTSVDHGTALDIVGQGKADAGSLRAALQLAKDCVQRTVL
ncbi:4-hydroxythreonine-4-phosphate dehydrogenase PdxA [Marinicella sp. S1101]|uniref:4-hydroxythreonine-4-phosphate dehydrogenase PdxA n=1 Tax=Marinicella marina TaxID=2996016 RepID=UPI002260B612|nr:4-hydroxythreonine-4-phosphate dehydrogenase PdxA [Marinicella marina]MCX7553303.1 4-hydroxythreonine-4-phosphate dehydrogenase PdxA [Marinicella marina]MDJ1139035.1 4-hydroxythreonine-4-phosphate dehydrogenase PdxA [Marinicella marina]